MKLVARPVSKVIAAKIHTPTGVKSVSTGTTDMKEAKAIAKAANIESIEVLSKAGQLTQELIQKLTVAGSMTVQQVFDEWSEWLTSTAGSDRTSSNHSLYVNAWMRDMKLTDRRLCSVKESDVSKWINAEDGTKFSTRTARLAAVRSFFRFCSIKNYLNPDPSRGVAIKANLLSHEQKETTKKQCFTDEEFRKIIDHLSEKIVDLTCQRERTEATETRLRDAKFWYCASLIGRYSGLRLGDIACLEWASLRTSPGNLVVWTDKRNVRVDIPIDENLKKGILAIEPNNKAHCFPEQNAIARDSSKRSKLSVQFSRILDAVGVEEKSFHCLRSTLATELNVSGKNIKEIAEALGHRSTKTTEGYIRPQKENQ